MPLIDRRAFGSLVAVIGATHKNEMEYTRESIGVLQAATEHYWLSLMEDSLLNAINGRRLQLTPRDVQLALRVRQERE